MDGDLVALDEVSGLGCTGKLAWPASAKLRYKRHSIHGNTYCTVPILRAIFGRLLCHRMVKQELGKCEAGVASSGAGISATASEGLCGLCRVSNSGTV